MFELLARYQKRELALILTLVGAILLAPVSTYIVWPEFTKLRSVSASRDALVATAANEGELSAELDKLRSNVQTLERRLHGDMANLPPKEVEAYIIGRLQAISWRNRVELVGVEPGTGEVIEAFREMLFTVRLAGDYFDLYNWLRDLGEELGFVVIKRYQVSPIDRSEQTPRLAAELTIASYRTAGL
jgi:Tfp pilus assembly protein PilO